MNSKELIRKAIHQEPIERLPSAPHWWGIYKYEISGLDYQTAAWKEGKELVPIYETFYQRFKPDWFHLHIGTPRYFRNSVVETRGGTPYLRIDPSLRAQKKEDRYFSVYSGEDEKIIDFPDYLLDSRCKREKVDLSSRSKIDEFIDKYVFMSAAEIRDLGYTDHVKILSDQYGDSVYIAVHIPSAICEIFDPHTGYLGFEQGLMALTDQPDGIRQLFARCYEAQLEWAKAFAAAGAHGYIISESFISPDIAGEEVWRSFMKSIHTDHFTEIGRYGIDPMCMFWGDVNPHIEDFKEIGIAGLMVEESKKTFSLDSRRIHQLLNGQVCLFGNIDSITLLKEGSPEDIRAAVASQTEGIDTGFIAANGSPITPGTPVENVKALM